MGLPGPLRDLAIKPPEPLRPDPLSLGWLTWGPTSQDPLAASYAFGLHFTMVLGAGWGAWAVALQRHKSLTLRQFLRHFKKQIWDPMFVCNCFWSDPGPFCGPLLFS